MTISPHTHTHTHTSTHTHKFRVLVCEQTRPLEPVQVAPGAALPEVFRGTKYWGNCVEVVNLALLKVYKAVESQIVDQVTLCEVTKFHPLDTRCTFGNLRKLSFPFALTYFLVFVCLCVCVCVSVGL